MSADHSVSVVIATYNRADVVTRAMDSALCQDHRPLEVVVVDDGSTDDTAGVVASYGSAVQLVRQTNRERGAARNAGLAASSGNLVAFLDSDDEMREGHVSRLVEALARRPEAGLAYSQAELFDDETGRVHDIFPREPMEGNLLIECATRDFMALSSVLVRRSLLDRVGWFDEDRELAGCEDWELWTRCLSAAPVVCVPGPSVRVHLHPDNTTSNSVGMDRAVRKANEKILDHPLLRDRLSPHRRALRAKMWVLLAHHWMLAGNAKAARSRLIEGWRENHRVVFDPAWAGMVLKGLIGIRATARMRDARRRWELDRKIGRS